MKFDFEAKVAEFNQLIDQLSVERYGGVQKLLDEVGKRYMTAPASSQKSRHEAFDGGLFVHSLQMTKNLLELAKIWGKLDPLNPKYDITQDALITCGLFHDIGKIGSLDGTPYYIRVTDNWKIDKGYIFEYNKKLSDGLTHAQRSVRILTKYMDLTDSEYLAILAHDGLFVDENKVFAHNQTLLSFLLHSADYYTAFFDSDKER